MRIQVAIHCTGVYGDRHDLRVPTGKLGGEEDVSSLGSPIAVPGASSQERLGRSHAFEGSRADDVSCGGQGHNAHVWGGPAGADVGDSLLQCRQEQLRQEEVADMVGTKLDFEAFLRLGWRVAHGACIEDQEV